MRWPVYPRKTWAQAAHDAWIARQRCRKTGGKEPCRQITCPRCFPRALPCTCNYRRLSR